MTVRPRLLASLAISAGLFFNPMASSVAQAQDIDGETIKSYAPYAAIAVLLGGAYMIGKVRKNKAAAKAEEERIAEAEREAELAQQWTLEGKDVTALELRVATSDGPVTQIAPGSSVVLVVVATLADGSKLESYGLGDGHTPWSDYAVVVDGGEFSNGTLSANGDPRTFTDHTVSFTVSNVHDPSDKASLAMPVNYKADFVAQSWANSGNSGDWGREGTHGRDGSDDDEGSGGPGSNGGDGGSGQTGGSGTHASSMSVDVQLVTDPTFGRELLEVTVQVGGGERFYMIDPDGGSMTIYNRGGSGGSGGPGGRGGNGGDGGRGRNSSSGLRGQGGNGADGGNGGDGGDGGDGGNGGAVTITFSKAASKYQDQFHVYNGGGSAGSGGNGGYNGSPGMGGSAYDSGDQGRQGESGRSGQSGRDGQGGPPPVIKVR